MRRNVEFDREPHIFTLVSNNQTANIWIQDASPLDLHSAELGLRKSAQVFFLGGILDLFWCSESFHFNLDQIVEIVAKIILFAILGGRKATENSFERLARLTEDKID